jgi:hypothetical protein
MKEQNFLIDRRTLRKMVIGSMEIDTTNQIRNNIKRKSARRKLPCNSQKESTEKLNISILSTSSDYDSESDNVLQKIHDTLRQFLKLNLLLKSITLYYQTHVIDIIFHTELGWPRHYENCVISEIIDKNKLRRKRKKTRQCILAQAKVLKIPALYFDSQKDRTLYDIKKDR